MGRFQQNDIKVLSESLAYDGFFKLKKLRIAHRLFNGGWTDEIDRELCVRNDAVGVLLFDPQTDRFAMVEQLRMGVLGREQSPWLLELVAGILDKPGEALQEVARRESREEAGLEVLALEPIRQYFCSPGGSTEYFTLFCGRVDLRDNTGGVFGVDGEHEDIRLHVLPVDEVLAMMERGEINNAMSIIALQWFQLHRHQLDAIWHD